MYAEKEKEKEISVLLALTQTNRRNKMKNVLLALLLGFAGVVQAATPTNTPTTTPTATPTRTPGPIANFDPQLGRDYVYPESVWSNNGVILASAVTTPLPGAESPWVAQVVSQTAFVLGTGTAKARFTLGIRGDYKPFPNSSNMNVWAYASTTATATAITVQLDVSRNPMNLNLPSGGVVYPGTATNVTPSLAGSSTAGRIVRFKLPLSTSARFQPGDHLSFDLQKTGGTNTNLYIYRLEVEYFVQPYRSR